MDIKEVVIWENPKSSGGWHAALFSLIEALHNSIIFTFSVYVVVVVSFVEN